MKSFNDKYSSYFLFFAVVGLMGVYIYLSKDKSKKIDSSVANVAISNPSIKNFEFVEKLDSVKESALEEKKEAVVSISSPDKVDIIDEKLPSVSSFISNPEPMLKKLHQLTIIITKRHEDRITDVLKSDNKEELFDKYIQLKNERGARFFEQIKIDNSRVVNQRINSEYQAKLLDVFGEETFTKYRSVLKESNKEARAYNIILDF